LHVLQGEEQAVAHTGRSVTVWTPQVLHGAYPAVQLWHVEQDAHAAGAA
jgi:hypothetical protein